MLELTYILTEAHTEMRANITVNKHVHRNRYTYKTNLGLGMNGTHQVLTYELCKFISPQYLNNRKKRKRVNNACKNVGFAVNTQKSKYMDIGHHDGKRGYYDK